jgi:magnesium-transporting ATPase (P-type)
LFLGWVPFVIALGHYNTAFTEWLVQAYFITFSVFINYPRWYEKRNLRKSWFWKAMLLVALVPHPAILAVMWFVDVSTKTKWHATASMLAICAMAGVLDFVMLNKIVDHFRPPENANELVVAPECSITFESFRGGTA